MSLQEGYCSDDCGAVLSCFEQTSRLMQQLGAERICGGFQPVSNTGQEFLWICRRNVWSFEHEPAGNVRWETRGSFCDHQDLLRGKFSRSKAEFGKRMLCGSIDDNQSRSLDKSFNLGEDGISGRYDIVSRDRDEATFPDQRKYTFTVKGH